MKTNATFKQRLSMVLCFVLIAVMALTMTSCGDSNMESPATTTTASSTTTVNGDGTTTTTKAGPTELGIGQTSFLFNVVDKDGNKTEFKVLTDETNLGTALQNLNLIDGEQGDYGLYVKTVNGITLDYNTDGMYWALYVNGEYGMTGVDSTEIVDGATYEFRAEK